MTAWVRWMMRAPRAGYGDATRPSKAHALDPADETRTRCGLRVGDQNRVARADAPRCAWCVRFVCGTPTTTTRLIFLDVDGVLNSLAWVRGGKRAARAERKARGDSADELDSLDPANVACLNALTGRTGAALVVSSAWRQRRSFVSLCVTLRRAGVAAPILGATPRHGACRGAEIAAWLADLDDDAVAFVVLDDESDMDGVAHRLVQTDYHGSGLTMAHVERAAALFAGEAP